MKSTAGCTEPRSEGVWRRQHNKATKSFQDSLHANNALVELKLHSGFAPVSQMLAASKKCWRRTCVIKKKKIQRWTKSMRGQVRL